MSLTQLSNQAGKVETLIKSIDYQADPLLSYQILCANKANNLLLESAEINTKQNLHSWILIDAALKLVCNGNQVECIALTENGESLLPLFTQFAAKGVTCEQQANRVVLNFPKVEAQQDEMSRLKSPAVLDALRTLIKHIEPLRSHPQAVFLAGLFSFDLIAGFEHLPPVTMGENTSADYVFYLAETLMIVDHQTQQTQLLGSVFSGEQVTPSYLAVSQRLEQIEQLLANTCDKPSLDESHCEMKVAVNKSDQQFADDVESLKAQIQAGNIFQVVPSRTFSLPCPQPFAAYAELRKSNPSPYMFYMRDSDYSIFGASPESALKYCHRENQIEIYPIAGTRPRGKHQDGSLDLDLDSRIELELRNDKKEKAEHMMLVDLARNDVARVSQAGSRFVSKLLSVDRYSNVMHLVSKVTGKLRDDLDALHAYQACMNMGTLTGAPKLSAANLIRQVEKQRRGSYGGAIGYLNGQGDLDTCIVIRSAFVKQHIAHIQAGAGVVFDSDPIAEANETRHKAQAVIDAILRAHQTSQGQV